jgi:hypothetical protein
VCLVSLGSRTTGNKGTVGLGLGSGNPRLLAGHKTSEPENSNSPSLWGDIGMRKKSPRSIRRKLKAYTSFFFSVINVILELQKIWNFIKLVWGTLKELFGK